MSIFNELLMFHFSFSHENLSRTAKLGFFLCLQFKLTLKSSSKPDWFYWHSWLLILYLCSNFTLTSALSSKMVTIRQLCDMTGMMKTSKHGHIKVISLIVMLTAYFEDIELYFHQNFIDIFIHK